MDKGKQVLEDAIKTIESLTDEIKSDSISVDEVLRQTAEEAAELAQAVLKLIRAHNGETPYADNISVL